jgi:hypothetical protein
VSGSLRADGNYMKLEWKETRFSWTWQGSVCTGVSSLGKQLNLVELVERTGKANASENARHEKIPSGMFMKKSK